MRYGARVEQYGNDIGESKTYAMEIAKKEGLQYINGYVRIMTGFLIIRTNCEGMMILPLLLDRGQLLWSLLTRWTD